MSEILKDLLKPCPLCGGEADFQFSYYFRYARIFCKECGLSTLDFRADYDGKKNLIKLWNTRKGVEMTKPKDVLTEYEDIYLRLADLQAELERARKEAIPPEVRELLETIEAEYKPKIEALQEKLKLAESGVKQLAFDLEMTLRGNVVMAVYRKGSTKWDEKHLERLAAEFPRILEAKVEGKPSVAIQRIK